MNPINTIDEINNNIFFKNTITYKINEVVEEENFCLNSDEICAKGIHYFKSIERAFYCFHMQKENHDIKNNGTTNFYNDNGQLKKKIISKNLQFGNVTRLPNDFDSTLNEWDVCEMIYRDGIYNDECKYYTDKRPSSTSSNMLVNPLIGASIGASIRASIGASIGFLIGSFIGLCIKKFK